MKNKLFSLLAVLIVLFGFIGCPEPEESGMQVYNADKTTKYTGGDLDFYIQGDAAKTICAKIRKGKLTIEKINLPEGLSTATFTEATDGLERKHLTLISKDGLNKLEYLGMSMGQIAIFYYNKDGSYNESGIYTVKKGWNFVTGLGSGGAKTDPADDRNGQFRWVVVENL